MIERERKERGREGELLNSQWLSGFSAPLHALSSLAQLCLSALQTQTRTRTARDPADGLSYTHQACGVALKTGKAHSAIHGANFNAQLRKSQKSCHACFFFAHLVMAPSSFTLGMSWLPHCYFFFGLFVAPVVAF